MCLNFFGKGLVSILVSCKILNTWTSLVIFLRSQTLQIRLVLK